VANVEGDKPDFDKVKLPGEEEESLPAEPLADDLFQDFQDLDTSEFPEPLATDEAGFEPTAEPVAPEGEPAATEEAVEGVEPEGEAAEKPAKAPGKLAALAQMPQYVEWGVAAGVSVLLLAIAVFGLIYFATAVYVISIGLVGYGIWKGGATNTVYTVILGCTLLAVLTAIYCLWLELGRYHFDIKAREAKQRVSVSVPLKPPAEYA
jgi:hypothetical protein